MFIAIVAIIILAFLLTWMWKNYNHYTRIEKESFKKPKELSQIKSGTILKTVAGSEGKIQLSVMELDISTHVNGSLRVEELIPAYYINWWYFKENIPEELQKLNALFVIENDDGKLKFTPYKGILLKKSEIFKIKGSRKTTVIELKMA
ncbi:MAG: hypothetical protein WCW04_01010 [Candidatus Paceibacterota bacterium]